MRSFVRASVRLSVCASVCQSSDLFSLQYGFMTGGFESAIKWCLCESLHCLAEYRTVSHVGVVISVCTVWRVMTHYVEMFELLALFRIV